MAVFFFKVLAVFILPVLKRRHPLPPWQTHTHPCVQNSHQCTKKNAALDLSLPVLPHFSRSSNADTSQPAQVHFGLCMSPQWRRNSFSLTRSEHKSLIEERDFGCALSGPWARCQGKLSTCEKRLQPERPLRPRWPPTPTPPLYQAADQCCFVLILRGWLCDAVGQDVTVPAEQRAVVIIQDWKRRCRCHWESAQRSCSGFSCNFPTFPSNSLLFMKHPESEDHDTDASATMHPNNHRTHSRHSWRFGTQTPGHAANCHMKQYKRIEVQA